MPYVKFKVLDRKDARVKVLVEGWQQEDAPSVVYFGKGKRILSALLSDNTQKSIKILETSKEEDTGMIWNKVQLDVWTEKTKLIDDGFKIWAYAKEMMQTNCTRCHGLPHLSRFNANQWIGVFKGMSPRTSLTAEELRTLTQYVQKHANDMAPE